jgi:hypothetical protein
MQALSALAMLDLLSLSLDGYRVAVIMAALPLSTSVTVPVQSK